jgi:tetratricopeptide (TPR) repeat protein
LPEISGQTASKNHSLHDAARLIAAGELAAVEDTCKRLLFANPTNAEALFWSGIIAAERRDFPAAVKLLQEATSVEPGRANYQAQLGRCLVGAKQTQAALTAADTAMALAPSDPVTLDTIGVIYSFTGFHDKAAKVFEAAVKISPDNDSFWFNLGASLKFGGDFEAAEAAYLQAIEINPNFDKAIAALSHMRRQTEDKNHIAMLLNRLQNYTGDIQDEMRLSFALAKEYDDTGQAVKAFSTISDVSRRWRKKIRYSIDDDARIFAALQTSFSEASIATATPGHESNEPIFVTGMPRTGTTLTERIVSSHSSVYSAGELNKIGTLVRIAAKARANAEFGKDAVARVLAGDFRSLGERYIESTRPATGHTPHFVDKMPLNFLYVGFILLALPKAKVVCVRRNPMDTCLSNFRQLFSVRSAYYAYSYDILDCGRYYLMFDRLMRHWDKLFPGRFLQLNYEDIVEDQEAQTRRLLQFCQLDWEDQCLHFENNTAPIATASSAQVRQPVYRTALARWKNYAPQLEPLAELLREGGLEIET